MFAIRTEIHQPSTDTWSCLIAGIRLAREKQVNTRVIPTRDAIIESVDVAHEVYCHVFRMMPEKTEGGWPK
jgi:hypothetical protein